MCYSAMVNQKIKELGISYKARIQIDAFDELFKNRLAGSGAKVPRAMELQFLGDTKTMQEKRVAKLIREFRTQEFGKLTKDLKVQTERLSSAEKTLLTKVTKKAQNDQRIATDKIDSLTYRIERLNTDEITEADSRIFPGMYAPLIHVLNQERVISPFRYLLRPASEGPEFDRKYNGAYNMRRDSLDKVFWWKNLYGKHHAFMEIQAFWENVKLHDFEQRKLKKGEEEKNIVLRFDPEGLSKMVVPCIFDFNSKGDFPMQSFALITDDPNPEVAAVGHDRTPVIMKDKYLDLWLNTVGNNLESYLPVFEDKQPTYLDHSLAA
jgi:putative SOS response-associated peptidase YedK